MTVSRARHPLHEHTVSFYVPNDIDLSSEAPVQVLTGPNACGKSVYLKQIGLIAFMAHIGSFVPAREAHVGRLTRIFTKIRGVESITSGLSSFASDLAQMSQAVNKANALSLVLVDEFGKGTSTVDGQCLLHSCLSHWIASPDPPVVVSATHFRGIANHLSSPMIRFFTMESVDSETESGGVTFLYQLVQGVSDRINSSGVALESGIPVEIVLRGHEVSDLIVNNAPIRQFNTSSTANYLKKCNEVVSKALELDLNDSDKVKELLEYVKSTLDPKVSTS